MGTFAVKRWQDWISFGLGLWLAVSPWIVGYSADFGATANAAFVGLGLALGAHFEATCEIAAEWLNLGAGLWLVAAPFVIGFAAVPAAMVTSVAVGALVSLLAGSALSLDKGLHKWWHTHGAGH